jgi:hypothetical protein
MWCLNVTLHVVHCRSGVVQFRWNSAQEISTKIYQLFVFFIRGGIQNILDWCCHLYSSCGSTKYRSQQTKLWILGSTATFCGDCVKTCEDVALNFGENWPGCFTVTMHHLTPQSSPSSLWRNTKWLSSPPIILPWFAGTFLTSWKPVSFSWRTVLHGVWSKQKRLEGLFTAKICGCHS